MPPLPSADHIARTIAFKNHGLISCALLRAEGLTPSQIRRLTSATERWAALSDEVYRLRGAPQTMDQTVLAAVLDAGPTARLAEFSAGNWWGLNGCPLEPIKVVRTSATSRQPMLAQAHRVRDLPAEWTTVHRSVSIVRPEVLVIQLFAICSYPRAETLADRLWSMRLFSGASLDRMLREYGKRGRDGTAGVRKYLEPRGISHTPPDSGLESRFAQIAGGAGSSSADRSTPATRARGPAGSTSGM